MARSRAERPTCSRFPCDGHGHLVLGAGTAKPFFLSAPAHAGVMGHVQARRAGVSRAWMPMILRTMDDCMLVGSAAVTLHGCSVLPVPRCRSLVPAPVIGFGLAICFVASHSAPHTFCITTNASATASAAVPVKSACALSPVVMLKTTAGFVACLGVYGRSCTAALVLRKASAQPSARVCSTSLSDAAAFLDMRISCSIHV